MDILVIDDDLAIREAAVQLIEDADHYAEGAEDSKLAMEALKATSFDCVLLDLYLADENGLDVLQKIKEKYPRISVVMITGMGSIPDAVRATQLGALDFIQNTRRGDGWLHQAAGIRNRRDFCSNFQGSKACIMQKRVDQ